MALRISVDLDGLRWADLFRFVDLARNGGISAEDQVDVITYGSDPMSVSLSARIYPASEGFLSTDQSEAAGEAMRSAPLSIAPGATSPNGSSFGYDSGAAERPPSPNGSHYPAFDSGQERPAAPVAPSMPPYGPGYDAPGDRGLPPNGAGHYPAFDGQQDRMPPGAGGQFAGFEPFDRSATGKEPQGAPGGVESPYIEEFARLQEGLMRQVRRTDEVRPDRS
ncbi:conserved hypothetical protein [Frankia canadensis]|uniref:Uncharacterized protein n=1 Tax=Frankia canadensis TaxID=1836972 RepID=A0A2I2KYG4_9ACTN|nr:hypothetical protein [Frankia canadensis]SNQ50712.1 conserved hypothetical protein [Frankia canadensis]SOU58002.1 conserved hypothetical protein [Frankia canadensis]